MPERRDLLKSLEWGMWGQMPTLQRQGVPPPPLQKPAPSDAVRIDLTPVDRFTVGGMPLIETIRARRSRRKFTRAPLGLEELSFLLWATQGVGGMRADGRTALRTVPSAGARHPFETYLLVNRVEKLVPGLYRFLPFDHQIHQISTDPDLAEQIDAACFKQYILPSAVTFLWSALPERTEWRYADLSYRVILMDAGHMCQNLYLACEAIGAGTCAIGAYNQAALDAALGLDGENEFVIYLAPVGWVER